MYLMLTQTRNELETEYEHLRSKVFVRGATYYFSRQDCEDLLHDVVIEILENSLHPEDYCEVISRVLGKTRTERSRRRSRGF